MRQAPRCQVLPRGAPGSDSRYRFPCEVAVGADDLSLALAREAGASSLGSNEPNACLLRAERAGFEPAKDVAALTRLAGECLQPLGHLSGTVDSRRHHGTPPL